MALMLVCGMALHLNCGASTFEVLNTRQLTPAAYYGDYYRSAIYIRLQNGSPGPPDNGWGVGEVKEAVIDM